MKVHWVNGVGETPEKHNNQTTATQEKPRHNTKNPLNQTNHQNQSTTHEGGEEDRGLNRKFKRGVKDKGIGHWVNGVGEESHTRWRGRKEERNQKLNQTPNQDRLEVQFSS